MPYHDGGHPQTWPSCRSLWRVLTLAENLHAVQATVSGVVHMCTPLTCLPFVPVVAVLQEL